MREEMPQLIWYSYFDDIFSVDTAFFLWRKCSFICFSFLYFLQLNSTKSHISHKPFLFLILFLCSCHFKMNKYREMKQQQQQHLRKKKNNNTENVICKENKDKLSDLTYYTRINWCNIYEFNDLSLLRCVKYKWFTYGLVVNSWKHSYSLFRSSNYFGSFS